MAVPTSYATGTDRYPVLYLTDAQWQFGQTRTTVEFLARNGLIPEMIVVGVTNPDRVHDLYATRADFRQGTRVIPLPTSGNGDQFLDFIAKEMIPWTERSYRTSGLRILAGHSAGGLFALHAMRVKPGMFQALIAASPWLACYRKALELAEAQHDTTSAAAFRKHLDRLLAAQRKSPSH